MKTWRSSYVTVNGLETHYLEAGPDHGIPVILLHDGAWGGSSTVSWSGVLPHLAGHYRVIAPDLLGFGKTAKALRLDGSPYDFRIAHLTAFLTELGVKSPIHLVGTSFGGSMALHMLRQDPCSIASVISISGTGGPWRTPYAREILSEWDGTSEGLTRIVEVLASPSSEFNYQEQLTNRFSSASEPGHYRAMTAIGIRLPPPLRRENQEALSWPQQLSDVKTPVMLIHGKKDALVEPEWTQHLEAMLPHCEVVTHEGKHSPNLDQPTFIASHINEWVNSKSYQGTNSAY